MNKIFFILISFMVVISSLQDVEGDNSNNLDIEQNNIFRRNDDSISTVYLKMEPYGCTTEVIFYHNSNLFLISHGFRSYLAPEKRLNINEIAESVKDIIEHFKLSDEIRTNKSIYFNIGWRINFEPLIHAINNDESWPKDILMYLNGESTNSQERWLILREMLRDVIVKSKTFDPFVAVMDDIECNMKLKENFVEGLFFKDHDFKKETLIEWGVFSEQEAKKDTYPFWTGHIKFDLICENPGSALDNGHNSMGTSMK